MRNKYSAVRRIEDFVTSPGSRERIRYESRFDGKSLKLVEVGREDIQEQIESYAPYCDINFMLSRLKVGDNSVLSQRRALYGDFSRMPDNPIDAINVVHSAENAFGQLEAEERRLYNNDYRVWLAHVLNGTVRRTDSGVSGSSSTGNAEVKKEVSKNES